MRNYYILILSLLVAIQSTFSQKPNKPSSSEIFHQIQKLNCLASVLYIAAHPDDENTRLISYFSNDLKARTAYLSLTRGDGGQNLIGPELRELLGVIRTQELLEARKIDGGIQYFTRANDFGYSKHPDETLKIWEKDSILKDMVWIIRNFKPDIIINRFDHRSPGTTHGHHTSSAILSLDAFESAGKSTVFPDQLRNTSTWQPKRLFFNTSWWFYGSRDAFEKADKSNLLTIPIGNYFPTLGKSNQEIAALSRSCHQSQGFGSSGSRGEEIEYLEFLKGISFNGTKSIFDGIDITWNRIKDGKPIGVLLKKIENEYDFKNPQASLPDLLNVYQLIQNISDTHWKKIKTEEIKNIIAACSGLYLEASVTTNNATPGSLLKVRLEAINRSNLPVKITSVTSNPDNNWEIHNVSLQKNTDWSLTKQLEIPKNMSYTNPYWLNTKGTEGLFQVTNQELIGLPETKRELKVTFYLDINGVVIPYDQFIVCKINDDVLGEVFQPLDIVPAVSVSFTEKVILFNSNKPQVVKVKLVSSKDNISGKVSIDSPNNWIVFPKETSFQLDKKGEEVYVEFQVTPSKNDSEVLLKCHAEVDGQQYSMEKIEIKYPHIHHQTVLCPTESKAVKINLKTKNEKIAYIMGAGDEIPKYLQLAGYEVTILKPEKITKETLNSFDVVIMGIRAYNTVKELSGKQKILLDWVASGKNMIVQYNTLDDLVTELMSPYPLKISRDRITDENAEVRFINPKHQILTTPNPLSNQDFKGWTQEFGLYFPNQWDDKFTPILSMNDPNEKPKNGALLVANYGKGTYIYTGLSFFRELPAGVSGAYRLFANLIAYGKQ